MGTKGKDPKPFLGANINLAIVQTQYDLRGFDHPLGFRMKKCGSAKNLCATTDNFMSFAVGIDSEDRIPTDPLFVDYDESSFEDYLAMCKRLATCCNVAQKEAIQLIIKEIMKQSKQMKAKVAAGKMSPSNYLQPLEKDNNWGKAVIALAEAFEVPLDK